MTSGPRRSLSALIAVMLTACEAGAAATPTTSPGPHSVSASPSQDVSPAAEDYAGADAVIPMAGGPRGVAVADGSVWVASTIGDVLQRVDPATNRVTAEIDVGSRPVTLVTLGDELWVSVLNGDPESDDELVRVDTAGNGVDARVQVPVHHNVAVGGGLVWAVDLSGTLRSTDPVSLTATDAVASGLGPVALAANESAVYGIRGNGTAWRWPIAGGELQEGDLGVQVPGRSRIAATGIGVWVAVPGAVLLLDPTTLEVLADLSLPDMTLVNDLWVTDSAVWLSANVSNDELGLNGGSILRLDPANLEVGGTWRLGPESSGVVAVDGALWAVDQSDDVLARFPLGASS